MITIIIVIFIFISIIIIIAAIATMTSIFIINAINRLVFWRFFDILRTGRRTSRWARVVG